MVRRLDELARVDARGADARHRRQAKAGDAALPVRPLLVIVVHRRHPVRARIPSAPRACRAACRRRAATTDARAPLAAHDGQPVRRLHQLGHFRIERPVQRGGDPLGGCLGHRLRRGLGQGQHRRLGRCLHQQDEVLRPHPLEAGMAKGCARRGIGRGRFRRRLPSRSRRGRRRQQRGENARKSHAAFRANPLPILLRSSSSWLSTSD